MPAAYQTGRYRELVKVWHDGLIANGVEGYSREEAWRDYQTALLTCLYIPVAFHHINSSEGGGGLKLARAYMHRIFRAAVECNAVSVLDQ
ncbi:MAG: hypothetical protein R3351_03310 [Nitrospirales bacterium]|nr:hypothetical protein [Nitrospirales bacterium]